MQAMPRVGWRAHHMVSHVADADHAFIGQDRGQITLQAMKRKPPPPLDTRPPCLPFPKKKMLKLRNKDNKISFYFLDLNSRNDLMLKV